MLDCDPHRQDLRDRLKSARSLVSAAHVPGSMISREVRGLSLVLLYAAYENLMQSLCRSILESAKASRGRNKRLRPGFKLFAASGRLDSLANSGSKAIWRGAGLELVQVLHDTQACTVDSNVFPTDGSHMRQGQVRTICSLFELGDPAPILREVWQELDSVVRDRNALAHGAETADEVGRRYTEQEIMDKLDTWENRWLEFLDWVEVQASQRTFYLLPR